MHERWHTDGWGQATTDELADGLGRAAGNRPGAAPELIVVQKQYFDVLWRKNKGGQWEAIPDYTDPQTDNSPPTYYLQKKTGFYGGANYALKELVKRLRTRVMPHDPQNPNPPSQAEREAFLKQVLSDWIAFDSRERNNLRPDPRDPRVWPHENGAPKHVLWNGAVSVISQAGSWHIDLGRPPVFGKKQYGIPNPATFDVGTEGTLDLAIMHTQQQ